MRPFVYQIIVAEGTVRMEGVARKTIFHGYLPRSWQNLPIGGEESEILLVWLVPATRRMSPKDVVQLRRQACFGKIQS